MSLKYIYSSLARAEPTHRCASNAPISPAHNYMFSYAERQSLKCTLGPPIGLRKKGFFMLPSGLELLRCPHKQLEKLARRSTIYIW